MKRPEYICCVAHDHADRKHTMWCGKKIGDDTGETTFVDISHAAYHRMNQDRLLICPECLKAIIKALKS